MKQLFKWIKNVLKRENNFFKIIYLNIYMNTNSNKLFLFQLQFNQEQLKSWKPLLSSVCNPKANNCGPTVLNLMNILPREKAEYLGNQVKDTGSSLLNIQNIIMEEMKRMEIKEGPRVPIQKLSSTLANELNNGNITIIFLFDEVKIKGHVTGIARDLNGNFYLLDGQTNKIYQGTSLDIYLKDYTSFSCFYGINKNKRTLDDLLSYSIMDDIPSKKQRVFGGRKKSKKCKKCKKTKKCKKSMKTMKRRK